MPTPPPVGYKITSGRFLQPNCSAISYPIVFFPSIRYGSFNVDASNHPLLETVRATIFPQSLISPLTRYTSAPAAAHSFLVMEGAFSGMMISAFIPALAL